MLYFQLTYNFFLTGNNTDGKYFATSTKLLYDQVKTPFRIPMYIEKSQGGNKVAVTDVKITQVACGINHTVSIHYNINISYFIY